MKSNQKLHLWVHAAERCHKHIRTNRNGGSWREIKVCAWAALENFDYTKWLRTLDYFQVATYFKGISILIDVRWIVKKGNCIPPFTSLNYEVYKELSFYFHVSNNAILIEGLCRSAWEAFIVVIHTCAINCHFKLILKNNEIFVLSRNDVNRNPDRVELTMLEIIEDNVDCNLMAL